jgi:hypothetical protein
VKERKKIENKKQKTKNMIKNSGKERKNVATPQCSFLKYGERQRSN